MGTYLLQTHRIHWSWDLMNQIASTWTPVDTWLSSMGLTVGTNTLRLLQILFLLDVFGLPSRVV